MEHNTGKRIVVVGAGIVGASLAYHLASKGANVCVVEAGEIACGVTATSFAWINTSHSAPDPIAALRREAIREFHRLEAELPDLNIQWTGALCYGAGTDEALLVADHTSSTVYPARAHIQMLEPALKNPPEHALFKAEEGALDAVQATHALIAGAQAQGATVLTQTRVLGFRTVLGQVTGVETSQGTLDADVVLLAAGTAIKTLTGLLGRPVPVEPSPSVFIRYAARPGLVRTLISNTEMEVRQRADGTLLVAEDYLGDALEHHPSAIARRAANAIRSELAGADSLELQTACVGLRPITEDGLPVIGHLPTVGGVYVCSMHPGVALAAIVGRLASEEIMGGEISSLLLPCRPDRFF
jgi:glycine/D-amino acid oxidase-like deaminating enzyme